MAKVRSVTSDIEGQTAKTKSILDSLQDVPEQYRVGGAPSWAETYGLKRQLFAIFAWLGKATLYLDSPEHGVLTYTVAAPLFKPWSFSLTPELAYLVAHITQNVEREAASDITFNFRGRSFFLPCECSGRLMSSLVPISHIYGARIRSLYQAVMQEEVPVVADEDTPLPGDREPKPTLH